MFYLEMLIFKVILGLQHTSRRSYLVPKNGFAIHFELFLTAKIILKL